MHLHSLHGQAVAMTKDALLPHSQTAMTVYSEVAYHDLEGFATDLDERERIVADLGDKKAMILRNHGTLTIGTTVAEAFVRMHQLERACSIQVFALGGAERAGLNEPHQGVVEKVADQARMAQDAGVAERWAWPALLRKLDRIDPSYRT